MGTQLVVPGCDFCSIRPVYRLAAQGFAGVSADSLDRQIDRVREELGHLPARDQERSAFATMLNEMRSREPAQVINALLTVSEFAEANGSLAAAQEYARVALELAHQSDQDRKAISATRALSRVALNAGRLEQAGAYAQQACDLALTADDRGEWIRSIGQLAATYRGTGDPAQARDALLQALKRAREWGNEALIGLAFLQLCRHADEMPAPELVIEYGWSALRLLERNEDRVLVLTLLGAALSMVGLQRAADRCYALVTLRAVTPALRVAGLAGAALVAAESGDRDGYRERRSATMRELAPAHRAARAAAHLELGRAALALGDQETAREHLRETFSLLGTFGSAPMRERAEVFLRTLEQRDGACGSPHQRPDSRRRKSAADCR